ncbi:MAG: acetylglutamate kinase [Methanosarcinales archaeon]|nr:MAG: acetylglutamate kinase [Methanosarcinales archaeon]
MNLEEGGVLTEALPYIKEFRGSIVVVKVGGHVMADPKNMEEIAKDVVLLHQIGIMPIIVHGGGPEITREMKKRGKKPEFIAGLRVTDDDTLKITEVVLIENVNKCIVSLIEKHGAKGAGLSGKDGKLITAKKKSPQRVVVEGAEQEVDLGWVGEIASINPEILVKAIEEGRIPVIAPVAVDAQGNSLNVNADTAAGDIAAALHAKKFIILTDVPGILENTSDPKSTISQLSINEARALVQKGTIQKGMIPKVEACIHALEKPVEKVHILDGSRPHALLLELFTGKGIGTMIYKG